MRMRRRRVERCLHRASVAIEARVLHDALKAIEEIRRLDPNEPSLEELTAQLAEVENPSPIKQLPLAAPAPDSAPAGNHRFAGSIVLLAGAVAGGWWWTSTFSPTPASLQVATTTAPLADRAVAHAQPDPSVRVSEVLIAVSIIAEPIPGDDAQIATSGLATRESERPQPDARAAEGIHLPPGLVGRGRKNRHLRPGA